jgi:hypothetical protein
MFEFFPSPKSHAHLENKHCSSIIKPRELALTPTANDLRALIIIIRGFFTSIKIWCLIASIRIINKMQFGNLLSNLY